MPFPVYEFSLDLEDIICVCAGLITVTTDAEVVLFVHYKDYFEHTWKTLFPNAYSRINTICLTYLSLNISYGSFRSDEEHVEVQLAQCPLCSYAATN